ncbi:MAG: GNAT family N-acetyltransferase [Erythrobacter sp.]
MSTLDFTTHWIDRENIHLLARVAPGAFDHDIDPERLARYLAGPANWMAVAIHDGQVVGMLMAVIHDHPDKPTELFLDEMGTGDDWRRKGIARALIEKLFERADAEGIEEIWLGTETDNTPARGLYESFGHTREDAVIYYLNR